MWSLLVFCTNRMNQCVKITGVWWPLQPRPMLLWYCMMWFAAFPAILWYLDELCVLSRHLLKCLIIINIFIQTWRFFAEVKLSEANLEFNGWSSTTFFQQQPFTFGPIMKEGCCCKKPVLAKSMRSYFLFRFKNY